MSFPRGPHQTKPDGRNLIDPSPKSENATPRRPILSALRQRWQWLRLSPLHQGLVRALAPDSVPPPLRLPGERAARVSLGFAALAVAFAALAFATGCQPYSKSRPFEVRLDDGRTVTCIRIGPGASCDWANARPAR